MLPSLLFHNACKMEQCCCALVVEAIIYHNSGKVVKFMVWSWSLNGVLQRQYYVVFISENWYSFHRPFCMSFWLQFLAASLRHCPLTIVSVLTCRWLKNWTHVTSLHTCLCLKWMNWQRCIIILYEFHRSVYIQHW